MSNPTPAELALQAEIRRLQARISELEAARQVPHEIIEKSPVMINIMRAPDFTYELVNPAFQRLAPGKQFIGRRFADVWAEVKGPLLEDMRRVIETGRPFEIVDAAYTIERTPGAPPEDINITYSWIPLPGPAGKPDRILTLAYETTDAVRQRAELRALARDLSERVGELQTVLDAAPVAIWIAHDPECREIIGNQMAGQFYESDAGENVSANITAVRRFFQDGRELAPSELPMQEAAARGIDVRNSELEVLLPSGRVMNMLGNASPLRDPAGNVRGCVGTFLDITYRKRAEEALRESEAVLRSLFDSPGVMRGTVELNAGQIVHVSCNQAAAELFGVSPEEVAGKTATEAGAAAEVARAWVELYEKSRVSGKPVSMEYARTDANGRERWLLATAAYLGTFGAGRPRFGYTILDLTERKRAEEALRESEFHAHRRLAEIEAIYEYSPVGLCVLDTQLRFVRVNRRFAEMNGLPAEAHIGKTPREIASGLAQASEEAIRRVLETGEPLLNFEAAGETSARPGIRRSWNEHWFPLRDSTGAIVGLSVAAEETTDRKRAEERLREAQKMESLGVLASGVAHDFNNLLVGVVGNASLAQEMLPPGHPASELLDGVLRTGEQAAHLTRQMLAYSGKGKFVTELLDLSVLIPEMTGLVRPSIPNKVELKLDLGDDLPPTEADRGQIQQVFTNLTLNAAEAIGSHEGRITVSTGVREIDEAFRLSHTEAADAAPGKHVYLRVEDTGSGMDEATKARIFDPFFSTKFIGRGLGLAAVAGIVRGHRGVITVASAPGRGTTFTVLFPAAQAKAAHGPAAAGGDTALDGAAAILVVDDEAMVRHMVAKALERHGYTVLAAESGLAAIDVFRRHPGDIDLVVLDLSMPGMSGQDVLPELRKVRPGAKVLISSGYGETEAMSMFAGQRVCGFIQKPFTLKRIAEKVKSCLE
jgi:two-component system, cell cycle sensor histidine kinase and response regulator CckA